MVVDELRSLVDAGISEFYEKINTTNAKRFYLGMEFNKINNEEFYNEHLYSLNMTMNLERNPLYTPQINDISLQLPFTPILYNWDQIPKVIVNIFVLYF